MSTNESGRLGVAELGDDQQEGDLSQARAAFGWEHLLLAALLLGAGAIHVAMAPPHLEESTLDGAGFVVAGWAQLILAVAVVVRPVRPVLAGVCGVSALLIGVWAWSRTAGLPVGAHAGDPESVSIVDGVSVALEAVTLLLAAALLLPLAGLARVARMKGVALAGVVAAVAFTSAAVASPEARDHHGDGGHGHGEAGEQDSGHGHHDDGSGGSQHDDGHDHGESDVSTTEPGSAEHDDGHTHDDGHDHGESDVSTTEPGSAEHDDAHDHSDAHDHGEPHDHG